MGIINALDTKDPSGELAFNYMDRIKSNPDGGIYETIHPFHFSKIFIKKY